MFHCVVFGFSSPLHAQGPASQGGADPARGGPTGHISQQHCARQKEKISITVTVRERKGEKELEKGGTEGGGCDGEGGCSKKGH